MNTLQSCAVALLLLTVPNGISATALAQTAQISTDRDSCIKSNNAATPEPAIAACTRLLEALARGEIGVPEGAAVHVARGNLHALQGDVERAIGDYDRAIMLDPNRAVAFFNRAGALAAAARWTAPSRTTTAPSNSIRWMRTPIWAAAAPITRRKTMPLQSRIMTRRSASPQATSRL